MRSNSSRLRPQPFRAFTVKHTGIVHRVITKLTVSDVSLDPDQVAPPSTAVDTSALWDTGATGSLVSTATVGRLALVPIGTVMVNHAGGVASQTDISSTSTFPISLPSWACQ